MKPILHILMLSSEFPPLPGGIGNQAYHLASYLQKDNFRVTVITDQRGTEEEEQRFDAACAFNVVRIPKYSWRLRMYLTRLLRLKQYLQSADVLLATGKFSLWMGGLVGLLTRKPTVAIIHGTEVNFKSLLLKQSVDWALKQVTAVVAVSEYTKHLVTPLGLRRLVVIPNGYDPTAWQEVPPGPRLEGHPKVITVGRLSDRKGQKQLIAHWPKVLEVFPEAQYHCVGLAPEAAVFKAYAAHFGVETQVHFHGRVTHERLQQLYGQMDMAVMLSQETPSGDVEGFGIALLEANHYGIPSIGSKGCGIEQAIAHGQSGLLVDAANAEAFVESMQQLMTNRIQYQEGAKAWAQQHHWGLIIKHYKDLILSCI